MQKKGKIQWCTYGKKEKTNMWNNPVRRENTSVMQRYVLEKSLVLIYPCFLPCFSLCIYTFIIRSLYHPLIFHIEFTIKNGKLCRMKSVIIHCWITVFLLKKYVLILKIQHQIQIHLQFIQIQLQRRMMIRICF